MSEVKPTPPREGFAREFVDRCMIAGVRNARIGPPGTAGYEMAERDREEALLRLTAELTDLIAAQGRAGDVWLPIETVPKDGTEVIIYDSGADLMWIGEWIEGCNGWSDGTGWRSKATHWMPLPAIPSPTPATE